MVRMMERVRKVLEDPWFGECLQRIMEREKERPFCRHDLQHFLDVARIAYILYLEDTPRPVLLPGEKPLGDRRAKEIIYAAALVHDLGRWQEYSQGVDHALAGADHAAQILPRAGFTAEEVQATVRAVREHRCPGKDGSPLGRCLYRADKLARPCTRCKVRRECKKLMEMEAWQQELY